MTQRFPALVYVLIASTATLVACVTPKSKADSSAALTPPDTVKPAPVAMQLPDTTKKGASTAAQSSSKTTKRTSAKTTTKQKSDSHLGRDSVIRFDPRDPRRQLPTIPPKKPPQER